MTDVNITITINDVDEFKLGFLKAIPKPIEYQSMSDLQYLKQFIQDVLYRAYKTGKMKIAQETTQPTFTEDIVEVT